MLKKLYKQYRANYEAKAIIDALEPIYQKWNHKLPISFCIGDYNPDLTKEIIVNMGYPHATVKRIPTSSLMIHTS